MKEQRLIDANRLEDTWNQFLSMIDNVEAQPTVDPTKHGHWIFRTDGIFNGMYKCSVCRDTVPKPSRYCPMCGAKNEDEVTERYFLL